MKNSKERLGMENYDVLGKVEKKVSIVGRFFFREKFSFFGEVVIYSV